MLNDGVGVDRAMGSELLPWPKRLTTPPPRLEELGISSDVFLHDNVSLGEYLLSISGLLTGMERL